VGNLRALCCAQALGDREYIVDGAFTGADILIAYTLAWAQRNELPLNSEQTEKLSSETSCA